MNSLTGMLITKRKVKREKIRPFEIISKIVDEYRAPLNEIGISIDVSSENSDTKILITPHSFTQIIHNLLKNAKEVLNDGGNIEIVQKVIGNTLSIMVIDDGPGFGNNGYKEIFEPFFSTKESGSGLGLYITKILVEEDGGRISTSRKNGKTVFKIQFDITQKN